MDFTQDITALESLFAQETNNYHTTANLQGKPWYGVGLEDIDSSNAKDSASKKGIIRKMIDVIVRIINTIIEKIKSFFKKKDPAKIKEAEETLNTYKGPSEEGLAKAFDEFVKDFNDGEKHHSETMEKMREQAEQSKRNREKSEKDHQDFMDRMAKLKKDREANTKKTDEFMKRARSVLSEMAEIMGEELPIDDAKKAAREQIAQNFFNAANAGKTKIFIGMLSKDFLSVYDKVVRDYDKLAKSLDKPDDDILIGDLGTWLSDCRRVLGKYSEKDTDTLLPEIVKVVEGDANLKDYATIYITNTRAIIKDSDWYLGQARAGVQLGERGDAGFSDPKRLEIAKKKVVIMGQCLAFFCTVQENALAMAELIKKYK